MAIEQTTFKVVLLGEGCVGKTSLLLRYAEDRFSDKHVSTLQASFVTKKVNVDGKRVTLNLWDTAGQERFHALGPIYYRDSDAAILVYDITDEDSFNKVKNWVKELRRVCGNDVILFIIGNKSDLQQQCQVQRDLAENYAAAVGAKFCLCSAKSNVGVGEAFANVANDLCSQAGMQLMQQQQQQRPGERGGGGGARLQQRGIVVGDDGLDELADGGGGRKACC